MRFTHAKIGFVVTVLVAAHAAVAAPRDLPQKETAPPAKSAAERLNEPGPQATELAKEVGTWDVVTTIWPSRDAKPQITRNLVAERKMIGSFLQETLKPAPKSETPDFTRIDYLNYDRVEGRWKYVSLDTRLPVSIMPAWSSGAVQEGKISLLFQPQAFVGFGSAVEGRFMLSEMVITQPSTDRMLKQQYMTMADGTGTRWLMVQYEYTRRR